MRVVVGVFLSCLFCLSSDLMGSSIFEELDHAIQLPNFESARTPIQMSSDEIVRVVRPILRNRLRVMNYDRMFPVLQFLDHYQLSQKKTPEIQPIEAYKTFKFRPLSEDNPGGPCVSLTVDLYEALPQYLSAYIVVASLPLKYQQFGFPMYSHTGIVINYCNPSDDGDEGLILLDPSFDINEPLVIPKGGSCVYDTGRNGVWYFSFQEQNILCRVDADNPTDDPAYLTMTYINKPVTNPVECSAMPMILADRRLSFLSRREDGSHTGHLNIELSKSRIIWDKDGQHFLPISFKEIQNGSSFSQDFFAALSVKREVLQKRITRIIANKDILDKLYFDYFRLIAETGDFRMTGPLDRARLQEVLEENS